MPADHDTRHPQAPDRPGKHIRPQNRSISVYEKTGAGDEIIDYKNINGL